MTITAFDIIAKQPWAITPDALDTICAIARRENDSIEAVEARLGKPLQNTREVTVRGSTALIPVTGPVFRYANIFTRISGGVSTDVLATDFTTAEEDPEIDHIVMIFDTPGGVAAAISEMAHMIRNSSTRVTAYVDNMAASAGYWLASAADEIVISKTGSVGSIGAVLTVDTSKDDNTVEIVSSQSPNKRPDVTTEAGKSQIQDYIDALAQVFVDDVAANRGVTVDTVLEDFGQGGMKLGEAAVEAGMADRVSTLEEVIAGNSGVTKGGSVMGSEDKGASAASTPVINREYLMANHADLVATFTQEGHDAGATAGATAERKRIEAVSKTPLADQHRELVNTMMFDGETVASVAALAVLEAEQTKGADAGADMKADAGGLDKIDAGAIVTDNTATAATPEAKAEAKWDADAKLRGEFGDDKTAYMAWAKADAAGLVKVLGDNK